MRRLGTLMLAGALAALALLPLAAPAPASAAIREFLFVVDGNCCAGGNGGVIRVDPTTGAQTVISSGGFFTAPTDIAVGPGGVLYVTNVDISGSQDSVIRVDPTRPDGSNQTIVSAGGNFLGPNGIAVAADGTIYVTDPSCCQNARGGVIRVDPTTGAQTVISTGGAFLALTGITVAPNSGIYVTDAFGSRPFPTLFFGAVFQINPVFGSQTTVSSAGNLLDAFGIAPAADGTLYVTTTGRNGSGQAVVRVDPSRPDSPPGSNQTVVSSGGNFRLPNGVAVASDGAIYVADPECCGGTGGLIRIDPTRPGAAGANQTITSSGGSFVDPGGVAVAVATVSEVSVADVALVEGDAGATAATVLVTLDSASLEVVTVRYATVDGTATVAGGDYLPASGTLVFQPFETTKAVQILATGDRADESDETFSITLSNPTGGAQLGRAQAAVVIRDDDPTPPPQACTPLPRARTTTAVVGGRLQVRVEVAPLTTQQNALQSLTFDRLDNARVTLNGQPIAPGQTFTPPPGTHFVDFVVERATPGQATTVHLTVVDGCGPFRTFVGGGTAAGF